MRRTKIICTLGPASSSEAVMKELLKAGMNVARLNFSHGTHAGHKKMIERFRRVRDGMGLSAAVMLDTRGPEIRIGALRGGSAELKAGEEFIFTARETPGDEKEVGISCPNLSKQLRAGDTILIDDGKLSLAVKRCTETDVVCEVLNGGRISDHKGINIPCVHLEMPYLSEQDKADVIFGIENDVDFIAASFTRSKEDIIALRKFIDFNGGHKIKIIAKIENLEGIGNFEEILTFSDGIMVARGDMGVEVEYERLPGIQKKFIKRCYSSGKIVITATQMLDSMINSPSPTRAEITDVANAVFDGTSAVMLSGESAAGKYPVMAVKVMAKIAEQAESDAFAMGAYEGMNYEMDSSDTTNAICDAACTTARDLNAKAIIAVTQSGHTARRVSKFRPYEPIVGATPSPKTFHQLSLSWGVRPVLARYLKTSDELFQHAVDCAKQTDLVKDGDRVVIVSGLPLGTPGSTNSLKFQLVGAEKA